MPSNRIESWTVRQISRARSSEGTAISTLPSEEMHKANGSMARHETVGVINRFGDAERLLRASACLLETAKLGQAPGQPVLGHHREGKRLSSEFQPFARLGDVLIKLDRAMVIAVRVGRVGQAVGTVAFQGGVVDDAGDAESALRELRGFGDLRPAPGVGDRNANTHPGAPGRRGRA